MLLEQNEVALVLIAAVLFVATVILFFKLYHILYVPVLSQEQNEEKLLSAFEMQYGLSARECEVFRLAVKGRANGEIANDLYISESTVKFHMKNVLKKTSCVNRTELAVKFKKM
ncbi:MAG: LuxR family transcriptional regulator [Erysipelotrichia bacterium]|nr:LuxR family transcriptional regulator [Erysipelotrichia bacterium]